MSICYFYRMTSDTGFAPCAFEDEYKPSSLLSLACCKGGSVWKNGNCVLTGLRHTIGKKYRADDNTCTDEVVLAGILKTRIVYCARINTILPMTEYFSNELYACRMDQIYDVEPITIDSNMEYDKKTYIDSLKRNERHPLFHGRQSGYSSEKDMEEQHLRDKLGRYVLLSKEFSYFGGDKIVEIPADILNLLPKHRSSPAITNNPMIDKYIVDLLKVPYHSKHPTTILSDKTCGGCRAK